MYACASAVAKPAGHPWLRLHPARSGTHWGNLVGGVVKRLSFRDKGSNIVYMTVHPSIRPPLQHGSKRWQIEGLRGLMWCQQGQVVGICQRLNRLVTIYSAQTPPNRRGSPG